MSAQYFQYMGTRASSTSVVPSALGSEEHTIPLNLVALVISFLDNDPPSLAALCRTSRVFYYMTLPHLWTCVTLRSYSNIRYRKDDTTLPEGFGSASPFSMGLNALVTHNVSALVKNLTLEGDWNASDREEYSRVGRISEQAMILNIAVRAAVDKCVVLERFRWDLDTKLQLNVYMGLAALKNLMRLHLRFPSSRAPQPTIEIPALPNLRSFIFTNYDPLCHPDDISRLLLHATKLSELQMHFSPRMREAVEPSVQLFHFFRKNIAARRKLKLKRIGLYNLFARAEGSELLDAVDLSELEALTSLNTFGRDEGALAGPGGGTAFLDSTWLSQPDTKSGVLKTIRMDQLHRAHQFERGLERLYLVNARSGIANIMVDSSTDSSPSTESGSGKASEGSSWQTPLSSTYGPSASDKLKIMYFDQICDQAGPTLQHLIFPARWGLSISQMARLIRSCPNLTQLSCYFDCENFEMMRMLVPFLTKLWAIRLVVSSQCGKLGTSPKSFGDDMENLEEQERKMRIELATGDLDNLRYVGLGRYIWEIGGVEQVLDRVRIETDGSEGQTQGEGNSGSPQYREELVWRRKLRRLKIEEVQHVEIWRCDTLDVV